MYPLIDWTFHWSIQWSISNFQSSIVRSASLIFIKKLWKDMCTLLCPFGWNRVSRLTTLVNMFHNSFEIPSNAYGCLSMTRVNCLKSLTNIIDLPSGKAWRSSESILINRFFPIKLISSIKIYLIFPNYCCKLIKLGPRKGLISLICILSAEWTVVADMLKVASPVGARRSNGILPRCERFSS